MENNDNERSDSDENEFDSESSDEDSVVGGEEDIMASSDGELYAEEMFFRDLEDIKNNDPRVTKLGGSGGYDFIQNITNDEWEEIGRDMSNNTHLKDLRIFDGALNDEKISYLFRGLTKSSSIQQLWLHNNDLSEAGVRSMVPFLQHANNLRQLELDHNNIQSEGFNLLLQVLPDSPIEKLYCRNCGIESVEVELEQFPRKLETLGLFGNDINKDGCRGLAKLLQGEESTLTYLSLKNNIDDEGVAILVGALRSNSTLQTLKLGGNDNISKEGLVMLLKLVNDISSVKATLQSNHTLTAIDVINTFSVTTTDEDRDTQNQIDMATSLNKYYGSNPEAAGIEKVIRTQLHSATRAELAELQGVSHSVYSEINPLHLPEVLSLVGRRNGRGELFLALKSSIAGVISTVNRKECIKQRLAYLATESEKLRAESEKLHAELFDIEAAEVDVVASIHDSHQSKRRRK